MNLAQVRRAIEEALAAGDDAKVTQLIELRDSLKAAEPKPQRETDGWYEAMLQYTHG